jgi:hypothetical protein
MPYEQHRPPALLTSPGIAGPRDTPAAVDRLADIGLHDVTGLEGLRVMIPHATIVPFGCRVDFTG